MNGMDELKRTNSSMSFTYNSTIHSPSLNMCTSCLVNGMVSPAHTGDKTTENTANNDTRVAAILYEQALKWPLMPA